MQLNPGIPGAGDTELATESRQITTNELLTSILSTQGGAAYGQQIDTTTTANTIYIGEANPGTLSSAALWRIKKLNTASGVVTTWADGDANFDNVWNNRAALSYA